MDISLYLVLVAVIIGVSARTKQHHNVLYTTTTFTDPRYRYEDDFGQLASFSNTSVTTITGKIYEPPLSLFNCSQLPNVTDAVILPVEPFIVFVPLNECPYNQALIAEEMGALGILFHSDSTSSDLNVYRSPLKVVASLVTLTDKEINSLKGIFNFSGTTITIKIKQYSKIPTTSHTFYFVVFAFSVLVLLSLTWFFITYAKRCYDHCASRRRRVSCLFSIIM